MSSLLALALEYLGAIDERDLHCSQNTDFAVRLEIESRLKEKASNELG
jgi:hypothetical protein